MGLLDLIINALAIGKTRSKLNKLKKAASDSNETTLEEKLRDLDSEYETLESYLNAYCNTHTDSKLCDPKNKKKVLTKWEL